MIDSSILNYIIKVLVIQQFQISNVSSGIHKHHMLTNMKNMVGRTINVGKLTMLLHGATLRIQIKDGKNAIVLIQIKKITIISPWVTRLWGIHGAIHFTRPMKK